MKPRFRICFFSHSSQLAGAERDLLDLVDQLTKVHGVECTVATPGQGPLVKALEIAGAEIIPAEYGWWCDWHEIETHQAASRLGSDIHRLAGDTLGAVRRVSPDVICTNSITIPYGALTAAILDKPHIWNIREYGIRGDRLHFFLPFDEVLAFIDEQSNFIFGATKRLCKTLFADRYEKTCRHLYPSIEFPEAAGLAAEAERARSETLSLMEFASLAPFKQQEIAIQAVAKLIDRGHKVGLRLQGRREAPYVENLQKMIHDRGLDAVVQIRGFSENIYPLLHQADILLVSDPVHAFGRTAAEGMRAGKPVVYPAESDISEYMEDGITGLAYSGGDPTSMAECVERLIEDRELRIHIGERARRLARDTFTRDEFSGKFLREAMALTAHERKVRRSTLMPILGGALFSLTESARETARHAERSLSDREQREQEILAILSARDEELAAIQSVLGAREEELAAIRPVLAAREAELAAIKPVLTAREDELAAIKPVLTAREEALEAIRSVLESREQGLAATKAVLEARDEELRSIKPMLEARDEELEAIRSVLQSREKELAVTKSVLTARDNELRSIKPVLEARDQELAAIKPVLVARDEELATVKSALEAQNEELATSRAALVASTAEIEKLARRYSALRTQMDLLESSRIGRLALRIRRVR